MRATPIVRITCAGAGAVLYCRTSRASRPRGCFDRLVSIETFVMTASSPVARLAGSTPRAASYQVRPRSCSQFIMSARRHTLRAYGGEPSATVCGNALLRISRYRCWRV
jgi:hypothetical protein